MDNAIPICMGCHLRHHRAGDPRIGEIILEKKGKKWAEGLHAKRRTIRKMNKGYLREVIASFEAEL